LDGFFDELGTRRASLIEAVSMDLGPAFLKSVTAVLKSVTAVGHAPQALVCADVFHLVKLVGDALDAGRRDLWQQLRRFPDDRYAKAFEGSRWALLKNPEDLTENQAAQLAKIKRTRGGIWRAYEMKEQFRAIFPADSNPPQQSDCWTSGSPAPSDRGWNHSRKQHARRGIISNAIEQRISNGRVEGMNVKVRLIIRRSYGFHSAKATLALVMLACGPINLSLPHDQPALQTAA